MPLTIQQQLDEARAAYHQLVVGGAARVFVDSNTERLEFVSANRQQLWLYIKQLEAQLNPVCARAASHPLGFIF
jgi:hypothetical protein